MFHVVKRDGEIADFQIGKITEALRKAFEATGFQYSQDMLDMMGLRVTADFQGKIAEEKISVEDIQIRRGSLEEHFLQFTQEETP